MPEYNVQRENDRYNFTMKPGTQSTSIIEAYSNNTLLDDVTDIETYVLTFYITSSTDLKDMYIFMRNKRLNSILFYLDL